MERQLSQESDWKQIQKNTFTRWINEHLKTVKKHIESLESDLSDGLNLIALVEVLSGKQLPRRNEKPIVRVQKLENVNIAINFLTNEEGIKLVNIDSTDVVDGHLKLILGLIWTLILHYSIAMSTLDVEGGSIEDQKDGPSPKQRLLTWINNKMPDVPVTNFNKDWNDGKALGALVDALAPGLCPDWPDFKPEKALENTVETMKVADDWLNVPQLIKPEDVVNPQLDELSMMTYLSQYPNAKLKDGAPLRPRSNPNRVRCYGAGIQPTGVVVGTPNHFTIETFSAGRGEIEVFLQNPQESLEPIEIKYNDDRNKTYSCTYTPKMNGIHKIIVKFNGTEVPKSPFNISVCDPQKVKNFGRGLQQTGLRVGDVADFKVLTEEAGEGNLEIKVIGAGGAPEPVNIKKIDDFTYECDYKPEKEGKYTVIILFGGQEIFGSPFTVFVDDVEDSTKFQNEENVEKLIEAKQHLPEEMAVKSPDEKIEKAVEVENEPNSNYLFAFFGLLILLLALFLAEYRKSSETKETPES